MGLSWLQLMYSFLVTGDAQHRDSEHTEIHNKNYVFIVIDLYIATAILSLCCDFSTLLYHSSKSKTHGTMNIQNK